MTRTVVAFESEQTLTAISDLLEKNGIPVRCRCRSGQETIRAVKNMGGGVVVSGYKLTDMTAEQLAEQLRGDGVTFLVVAKGALLDLLENDGIFRIAAPFRPAELVGAVGMLLQLDQQRAKPLAGQRTQDEKQLVDQAKQLLMDREGVTEEQAHRCLQRRSMERSMKMAEVAKQIIASFE